MCVWEALLLLLQMLKHMETPVIKGGWCHSHWQLCVK